MLALFTGAVLVASLHAARPGGSPMAIGLALALADFLIGRFTSHFGTRWLVLLQTVLWMSTLVYVMATILRAIFASREVTVVTLLAALCIFLLMGPVLGVRLHPHRPDVPGLVPGVAGAGLGLGGRAVECDRVHAAVCLQLCDPVRIELRGGRPGDRVRL